MEQDSGSGVKLAIAILLMWMAGLAFFIAFEGSKFLTEQNASNGNALLTILQQLTQRAQQQEQTQ